MASAATISLDPPVDYLRVRNRVKTAPRDAQPQRHGPQRVIDHLADVDVLGWIDGSVLLPAEPPGEHGQEQYGEGFADADRALGTVPLAGLGIGTAVLSGVFWAFNFLGIGTQTEVAHAAGTGAQARGRDVSGLAMALGALIGCGLAARVLLPHLEDPMTAYPALAELVLPSWLAAFFTLALFATVMSTLDSYLFLSAATVGHDLTTKPSSPEGERRRTRYGLALSALLASAGALLFDSAVTVWHHVGSVVTSALLLPVVGIHLPARWRYSATAATTAMITAAAVALGWILAANETGYPLGVEPMFPALGVSAAVWVVDRINAEAQRR